MDCACWPQVLIEWADWPRAEKTAVDLLWPYLKNTEQHGIDRWHFIRKTPHWRLRYTADATASAYLDGALDELRQSGAISQWTRGIYEPEIETFGGPPGMDVAHRLFCGDSRNVLAYLARTAQAESAQELGRREMALLLGSVLLRGAGLDWYEQGDVWAKVATFRSAATHEPAAPRILDQVRRLMTVDAVALAVSGPLHPTAEWVGVFDAVGADLAVLALRGELRRGLRAILAHHVIFAWNRLGLPYYDQHVLSDSARKVVMSETTPSSHATVTDDEATHCRRTLVTQLRSTGALSDAHIEEVFLTVPRHVFVPQVSLEEAYANTQVHIKHSGGGASLSCASQPSVVAMLLQQLRARPGQHVLELGTGSGYNAGLLAHLVGEHGRVSTIDVDEDLVDAARIHLTEAGVTTASVLLGDGALGHPTEAPYDRIIATVGCHTLPHAWLDQLAPGGRLVAPVRIAGDCSRSIAFEADGDHWVSVDSRLCTFMPLRGGIGDDPRQTLDLTGDESVTLQVNQEQRVDADRIIGVLDQPAHEVGTGVTLGKGQPLEGMWLWLALSLDNALSRMPVQSEAVTDGLVTPMLPWGSMASATPDGSGLAYLTLRTIADSSETPLFEVRVIGHGSSGHALAEQMAHAITLWEPYRDHHLTFALYPDPSHAPEPAPGRFVLPRDDARLVVNWGEQP